MQFTRSGDMIRVVHVSGPTHNMLGLLLSSEPTATEIDVLTAPGTPHLAGTDVSREVCAGVAEEASDLGLRLAVRRIQFVPSDSGPASVYRGIARALVHRYAAELGAGQRAA